MSIRRQQMVRLKFEGRKLEDLDFWTKSDPFLTLSRPAKNGLGFVQVRRTETIQNNLNPSWKVIYIPTTELCDNNFQMPLNIEVYDEDRNSHNDLIGNTQLTLNDLQNLAQSRSPVTLMKGPKNRGQLLVTECQIEEPTADMERKGSITAYPASRRGSVYSTPGDLSQSRSEVEHQAAVHELLGQGQESYPSYQPYGEYNPHYQPGPEAQGFSNHHFINAHFTPGDQAPYQNNQSGLYHPPSMGYPLPATFPPTIPEDPTDTRPSYNWT